MSQQLVKKGANGRIENVNPRSWIEAIKDKNTGQTLVEVLQGFNMYFLPYNGNTSATRCLVPTMLRKKGLWITYVKYDGNVYTEWYAASEIDDKSWGDSSNWRVGNNTLVGDITISANGNWVINGSETEFKAVGEKGNTPLLRVANNRLQVSYNLGEDYIDVTDNPVYTKFRWLGTTGDTQNNIVGRIQSSTDEGKTWTNMSNDFTNNLHISRYIGVNESLPTSGIAEGTIYAKGPYYDEGDTLNDNPIYRLWVYAWKDNTLAWQDNGEFQSIAAGVVQDTGNSETEVMSQKAVTEEMWSMDKHISNVLSKEGIKNSLPLVDTLQNHYVRHDIPGLQFLNDWSVKIYDLEGVDIINVKGIVHDTEHFGVVGFSTDLERSKFIVVSPEGVNNIDWNKSVPNGYRYAYVTNNVTNITAIKLKHIPTEDELNQIDQKISENATNIVNVNNRIDTTNNQIPVLNFTTSIHDLSNFTLNNENLGSFYDSKNKKVTIYGNADNYLELSKGFNLNHSTEYLFIANIYDLNFSNDNMYFSLLYDTISFGKIKKDGLIVRRFTAHYEYKKVKLKVYNTETSDVYYGDDANVSFKCNFIGVIPFETGIYKYLKEKALSETNRNIQPLIGLSDINNIKEVSLNLIAPQCNKTDLTFVENIQNAYVRHDTQSLQIPFENYSVDVFDLEGVDAINIKGSVHDLTYFGVVGFSDSLDRINFSVISPTVKTVDMNIYVPKGAKYVYITKNLFTIKKLILQNIPSELEINNIKSDIKFTKDKIYNITVDFSDKVSLSLEKTIPDAYVSHYVQGLQYISGVGYNVNVYNIEGVDYISAKGNIPDPNYFGVVGFSSDLDSDNFTVINPNGLTKVDVIIEVPVGMKYAYATKDFVTIKKLESKHIPTEEEIVTMDNDTLKILSNELKTRKITSLVDTIQNVYVRHDTQSLQLLNGWAVEVYDIQNIAALNIEGSIPLPEYYGVIGYSSDLERTRFEVMSPNGLSYVNINTFIPKWAKYAYVTKGKIVLSECYLKEIPNFQEIDRTIISVGDSITQGQDGVIDPRLTEGEISTYNSYSNELAQYLPDTFTVKNYGAGGAKISEIFARMGWLCGILPYDFTLKGDKSKVTIANQDSYMTDNYKNHKISYFMQGTSDAFSAVRTAYIRGIECDFSFTSEGVLSVFRKELVDYDLNIKKGTELIFEGAKVNDGIFIVFAGANGSYTDGEDLADSIKHAVQQIEGGKYIVIGSHTFGADALKALRKEFGARFINLKEYLTSLQSFKDIGYEPLTDDEITEERKAYGVKSDIKAIEDGTLPPSYWRYSYTPSRLESDSVHLSKLGYKATAFIINKRLRELGYVK